MKQAFTLIELVFVCIILSLLFSMTYVYYKPDYLRLGAEQVLNDIKYTRHLALIQNDFRAKEFILLNESGLRPNGSCILYAQNLLPITSKPIPFF